MEEHVSITNIFLSLNDWIKALVIIGFYITVIVLFILVLKYKSQNYERPKTFDSYVDYEPRKSKEVRHFIEK
jgi:type II secretory pathway component PulF